MNTLTPLKTNEPYHVVGMFDDGTGGTIGVETSPAYRVRVSVEDAECDQITLSFGPAEILLSVKQAREIALHLLAAAEVAEEA